MAEETQESSSSETLQIKGASAAEYETALAHIERLQEQLDGLRSTIPSLLAPLVRPAASKAQMFADIKKSASNSTNGLKTFREEWSSEQTQQIFAQSKDSLDKNGDLGKAHDVPRYGWNEQ